MFFKRLDYHIEPNGCKAKYIGVLDMILSIF